ncbi:Probable serine/threonine-protein kinase SIS8 [Linum perenne]
MRNLFKKLHATTSNQQDDASAEGSASSRGSKSNSGLSNWLNSVTSSSRKSPSPPSSSNVPSRGERLMVMKPSDSVSSSGCASDVVSNPVMVVRDSGSASSRGPEIDEEYQIQLALEMSAIEDPEAAQIEAVKQISLGSSHPKNSPAEVLSYRYWNYNALSYDDKILDGFYDLYGILTDSRSDRMPSLLELQRTPVSESNMWEAVLVDRTADANLLKLEHRAREIATRLRSESPSFVDSNLVKKLATLVSNYMGGSVGDPENMSRAWRRLSYSLKATLGSLILPLGSLTIGMARHRALMFKVFADSVGIPSRLVKGHQFTGSDDVVMNFVKLDDGREYIIDLMADPGTLIPSDAAGLNVAPDNLSRDIDSSHLASCSSSGAASSFAETSDSRYQIRGNAESRSSPDEFSRSSGRQNYPYAHARSPSWTEGITPAARKKKVKDVSRYMIDAAKENPQLAQKLHDVLLESGVNAPPSLFTEFEQLSLPSTEAPGIVELTKEKDDARPNRFLPPLVESEASYVKNVPVAAAAAAAAAVVASSMVVAAARSNADSNLELPVAAAAAAVMATSAAVNKKQDYGFRSDGDSEGQEHDVILVNVEGERVSDRSTGNDCSRADFTMDDVAECEIPWEEITVGERIGLGSYGEVYHGEWHGTVSNSRSSNESLITDELNMHFLTFAANISIFVQEVAVKKFLVQDISGESLAEFKSEVQIMKRLRHPNVVLFMGAVTRSPNLSIVTEFLPRGSLYRLLHRPNNQLDERRRLRMALDAARGMNYLHSSTPVIVHRDLKSPNLLVDKNWVVKVCDFGLSRMKHSTFLSSRSTAGTAEWMAPEVLRNEPSDEKCDVYSYGVILWELCTMQQPWGGMNPMQVVGAVGFQHRRLEIPNDMDSTIADIIRSCWQTDPRMRPSFAEIMAALKPLQKPATTTSQVARHTRVGGIERGRPPRDSAER